MVRRSPLLIRFISGWPGRKTFGIYRFMPIFFVLGAAVEFSMINWHVGEVNFYKTFKKRRITEEIQRVTFEAAAEADS